MDMIAKLKQLGQSAKLGGIKAHGPSARKPLTHQREGGQSPKLLTMVPHVEVAAASSMSPSSQGNHNVCSLHFRC